MAKIVEVKGLEGYGQLPDVLALLKETIIPEKIRIKLNLLPDFTIDVSKLIQPKPKEKPSILSKLLSPKIIFLKEGKAYEVNPFAKEKMRRVPLTMDLLKPTWFDQYAPTLGVLLIGLTIIGFASVMKLIYEELFGKKGK
ncbi:MAG: hypothetical protein LWW95_08420 [Candidatus Desulfofervidus auxilii]|nr:hypothetical protein [Candidatus Desulfofervidus auxilii]